MTRRRFLAAIASAAAAMGLTKRASGEVVTRIPDAGNIIGCTVVRNPNNYAVRAPRPDMAQCIEQLKESIERLTQALKA